MSQANVEFVEALYAQAGAMDKQTLLAALPEIISQLCDPDVEWAEDPQRADASDLSRARRCARVVGAVVGGVRGVQIRD
jgi:hypothetical protein